MGRAAEPARSMNQLAKVALALLLFASLLENAPAQPSLASAPSVEVPGQPTPSDDAHAAAIDACRKALKARPNDPGLMFQLGRALASAGKQREAISPFLDAAERGHVGAMVA